LERIKLYIHTTQWLLKIRRRFYLAKAQRSQWSTRAVPLCAIAPLRATIFASSVGRMKPLLRPPLGELYKYIAILFFTVCCFTAGYAQQPGAMEDVQIEIIKERKITLPEAERKFTKIAPHASEPIYPPITYSFQPIEVRLPLANLAVRPLKLKKEESEPVQKGQFSVGYGNYASPYLEAHLTSYQNPKQLIGLHALMDIWAKGPVDKRNSGNGKYGVSLFANSFGEKVKTGIKLGYYETLWHFYGYPTGTLVEAKDVNQTFKAFSLSGMVANSSSGKFKYELKADFGYLTDNFKAKETKVDFDFTSAYAISKDQSAKINASYQIIGREDVLVEAKPRNLFQVQALYSFSPIEKLQVDAGFAFAVENDTIDKNFHFYPNIFATYSISDKVRAKAGLSGRMQAVSLHTLSAENPWLAPNVAIAHTNEAVTFGASLEANVGKNALAEFGASIASLKNLYFYKNDTTDVSKFYTSYDKGATARSNLFTSLQYSFANKASVTMRGDYYKYNVDTLREAWHRPTYKMTLEGSYNFYKKLKILPSLIVVGGMKAQDPLTVKTSTLPSAVDLSLRSEYFVSEKFLVFVHAANILNSDYSLYLNYPVRGFQVRAGFSWSF
jgi:hypothetical protein